MRGLHPFAHGETGRAAGGVSDLVCLADYVLVEADGAKRLPLKAHAEHEPVIPACAGRTVCMVGVDGLGAPVSQTCHRPQRFAQLAGVTAVRAQDVSHALGLLSGEGVVPVLVDPACACVKDVAPDAVVDAVLAKRNLGTSMDMAPIVVGVGPGFTAGVDCHAVVEIVRGHTLGRTHYEGSALSNTAVPGLVGGFAGGVLEAILHVGGTFSAR